MTVTGTCFPATLNAFNDSALSRVPGHGPAALAVEVEDEVFARYTADRAVFLHPSENLRVHVLDRSAPLLLEADGQRVAELNAGDCIQFAMSDTPVWGKVVEGMENVDKLPKGEPPREPGKIVSMKVAADAGA